MKHRRSDIIMFIGVLFTLNQLIFGYEIIAIYGLLFLILITLLAILDVQIYK